jgi:hypothetical protein
MYAITIGQDNEAFNDAVKTHKLVRYFNFLIASPGLPFSSSLPLLFFPSVPFPSAS